jgi:hypothetical protein
MDYNGPPRETRLPNLEIGNHRKDFQPDSQRGSEEDARNRRCRLSEHTGQATQTELGYRSRYRPGQYAVIESESLYFHIRISNKGRRSRRMYLSIWSRLRKHTRRRVPLESIIHKGHEHRQPLEQYIPSRS